MRNDPEKGDLRLTYIKAGVEILLNDPSQEFLHDLYNTLCQMTKPLNAERPAEPGTHPTQTRQVGRIRTRKRLPRVYSQSTVLSPPASSGRRLESSGLSRGGSGLPISVDSRQRWAWHPAKPDQLTGRKHDPPHPTGIYRAHPDRVSVGGADEPKADDSRIVEARARCRSVRRFSRFREAACKLGLCHPCPEAVFFPLPAEAVVLRVDSFPTRGLRARRHSGQHCGGSRGKGWLLTFQGRGSDRKAGSS